MQEALNALEEGQPVFVERGDGSRRAGQGRFELRGAGRPALDAGSSLPRLFPRGASWRLEFGAGGSRPPARVTLANVTPECWAITPAELHALFDADRGNACNRMIGDELLAGVFALGFLAGLDVFRDRFDAVRRHQQRILLGGRADDAVLDPFHALAAAVDCDDGDALLLARRLQSRVTAIGRRFVDRIDQVDVDAFWRMFSIALRPPSIAPFVTSEPTICGLSLGNSALDP